MIGCGGEAPGGYGGSTVVVVIVVVVVAGCVGAGPAGSDATTTDSRNPTRGRPSSPSGQQTATATERTPHPAMASQLWQLATAANPESFAEKHNIELENGSVAVLIELDAGKTLPDGYVRSVVTRSGNRVVAWVPVDRLVPLADHGNVSFVRRPVDVQTY